jgi:hypothetical protein
MNGAGTDDDEQSVAILAMENPTDGITRFDDESRGLIRDGKLRFDGARGRERVDF